MALVLSEENEVRTLCRRQKVADAIGRNGLAVFEPDGSAGRYRNARGGLFPGRRRRQVCHRGLTVQRL